MGELGREDEGVGTVLLGATQQRHGRGRVKGQRCPLLEPQGDAAPGSRAPWVSGTRKGRQNQELDGGPGQCPVVLQGK